MKTYALPLLLLMFMASCRDDLPTAEQVGAAAMPAEIAPIADTPFPMASLTRPVFPDLCVSIDQRGAQPDSLVTDIINQAICDVHEQGGGSVRIPAGHWLSGRIMLKSNVNLHLDEGARLEFSPREADYLPPVFTRHEGIEVMAAAAFIYAYGEANIAVTGAGTIVGPPDDAEVRRLPPDGFAAESVFTADMPVDERVFDGRDGRLFYRPMTISPTCCTDVLIEGIHIIHGTFWNVVPVYCQRVIVRGISVESVGVPSGDGIDIESCSDVLIEYCTLNCGDDCFTLKAGRGYDGLRVGRPTERVVVRHCLALKGHGGMTCGSETAGVVRDVYLHNCVFLGTRVGLRFKTRRTRGGGISDITCRRVRMTGVGRAMEWDLLGSARWMGELSSRDIPRPVGPLTPVVRNIHISDFRVDDADCVFVLNGIPEMPCANVLIERGKIRARWLIPALNDVDSLTLSRVDITTKDGSVSITDARHIVFDRVDMHVGSGEAVFDVQGPRSADIVVNGSVIKP